MIPICFRRVLRVAIPLLALAAVFSVLSPVALAATPDNVALPGYVPPATQFARPAGRVGAAQPISLALALPLRNQAALDDLLKRLYDSTDPLYGHYLTPTEFTERFGPTKEDYDAVIAFAQSRGLTVTGTHPNRVLLDVTGSASAVEAAFGVSLLRYQRADHSVFYAPDTAPVVPAEIAARLSSVVGLDNAGIWRAHRRVVTPELAPFLLPNEIGSGPNNGLAPSDIKTAYNLNTVTATGMGQILGLFELDGYHTSDITAYENYFHLPSVSLQNVLVDGFNGGAGSGADEVTLDIELQVALAPGAQKVIIYEAPNSDRGVVDTYNRIATDNAAKQISTSWGLYESGASSSTISSENTAFQQMASQGQTIYAAAGDSGAYDNGSSLSVDDPASQPYMCGVGGTALAVNADRTYRAETTWNSGSVSGGAGGGGISALWAKPSYQSGVGVSSTMRNVPDVSLDADPNTGYAIYFNGGWTIYGGTSCAAPLWAAFTALVNQQNVAHSRPLLGAANPSIYSLAEGARGSADFHDIADNSTNLYYPATTGYDDATGWGSFNGANLWSDLSGGSASPVSYQINSGGGAVGSFTPDADYSGGIADGDSDTIDTSAPNAAPAAVYQRFRYASSFHYTFPGLTPSATYTIRLHFAEAWYGVNGRGGFPGAGRRRMNVSVNGVAALTNFDVYASAGAADKAVGVPLNATADTSGTLTIAFSGAPGSPDQNAFVNGITVAPATVVTYQINSGGGSVGSFTPDAYGSGGVTGAAYDTFDTSAANAAPAAVYQTFRYGSSFGYAFPGLTPGTAYTVRLHFAEPWWGISGRGGSPGAGKRLMTVGINGSTVLSNFDVYATAGRADKAVVEGLTATADGSGKITVTFSTNSGSPDSNAFVNGIEILR